MASTKQKIKTENNLLMIPCKITQTMAPQLRVLSKTISILHSTCDLQLQNISSQRNTRLLVQQQADNKNVYW